MDFWKFSSIQDRLCAQCLISHAGFSDLMWLVKLWNFQDFIVQVVGFVASFRFKLKKKKKNDTENLIYPVEEEKKSNLWPGRRGQSKEGIHRVVLLGIEERVVVLHEQTGRSVTAGCHQAPLNVSADPYATVAVLVEDLRRQRDAVAGLVLLRHVGPHPHAVLLVAGNVQLGVVHLESLQEADHILLLLLDLGKGAFWRNTGDTIASHGHMVSGQVVHWYKSRIYLRPWNITSVLLILHNNYLILAENEDTKCILFQTDCNHVFAMFSSWLDCDTKYKVWGCVGNSTWASNILKYKPKNVFLKKMTTPKFSSLIIQ